MVKAIKCKENRSLGGKEICLSGSETTKPQENDHRENYTKFRNSLMASRHNADTASAINTSESQICLTVRLGKTTKWICKDLKCEHYRKSESRRCFLRRNRPGTKICLNKCESFKEVHLENTDISLKSSPEVFPVPKFFLRSVPSSDQIEIENNLKKKNFKLKLPKASKGIEFIPEDEPLFDENKIIQNIVQGKIGDCALISVVASMVDFDPQILYDLFIVDRNPANYVALYIYMNGKQTLIHMDGVIPLINNCAISSSTETNSLWLIYLEKALAYVYGGYDELCEGNCGEFYSLLTGAPVDCFDPDEAVTDKQKNDLLSSVKDALKKKKMITLATKKEVEIARPYEENHAYTLIGYDNGNFKVLNPWHTQQVLSFSEETLFKSVDLVFVCEYEKDAIRHVYPCENNLIIRLRGRYIITILGTHFRFNKKPKRTLDPCFEIRQLEIEWSSYVDNFYEDDFYQFNFSNCKSMNLLVYEMKN